MDEYSLEPCSKMIASLFSLFGLILYGSCADTVWKYARGNSTRQSIDIAFSDSQHVWSLERCEALKSGLFSGSNVLSDYRISTSEKQKSVMTYLSRECGLIEWMSALPSNRQWVYIPLIPTALLCENWGGLKRGICLNHNSWKGCLVQEHRRELSVCARQNSLDENRDIMILIKDSAYISSVAQSIQKLATTNTDDAHAPIVLLQQLNDLQSAGDSLALANSINHIWSAKGSYQSQKCRNTYKFDIMRFVIGDDEKKWQEAARLWNLLFKQPTPETRLAVREKIEYLVRERYYTRFAMRLSEINRGFFSTCQ